LKNKVRRKCLAALATDGKQELEVTAFMGSAGTGIAPPERVSSTNQLSIDEGSTEEAWNSTREMRAEQNSNFSM
jgi:hypothetical protein